MLRIPLPEDDGFALRLLKRCARRGGRHTASGKGTAYHWSADLMSRRRLSHVSHVSHVSHFFAAVSLAFSGAARWKK